ncbi:MAG TPA: O-antigen ligase family protein [Alphaproteobacteria bacterium]|nr:O-antigen ligase family protein [Alphaproteobacteria bacterium]
MAHSDQVTRDINYSAIAFWSFTLSVVLLPIGLGGDRVVPLGLAQAGLAVSALCLMQSPQLLKSTPFFPRLRWALGLLAAVLVWCLVQTLSFVPMNWMHPMWQETAVVLNGPVVGSISIVPEDALKGLMRLITYIVGGLLAYILAQDPKRAKQLIRAFWITGVIICLYGLIIQVFGLQQILWFKKWTYQDDLTATFVNRNHFAIYCGMVLTTGLALLMQSWREMIRKCKPHQRVASIKQWGLNQAMPQVILLVLIFDCLVLSHSRAGLTWSLGGMAGYLFFYQLYQRSWLKAMTVLLISGVLLVVALCIAMQVSDRFATLFDDYSSQTRGQVYSLTWRMFTDNPWLGYGLDGFEPEFRLYQHGMYETFNHAHSDVLESLLDLGAVAGLALWGAIALFLSGLWHGVRNRRQNGLFPVLALASSIMVLGHSTVDFDLQIPGVALTWAVLLGVGLAQSWPRVEKKTSTLA